MNYGQGFTFIELIIVIAIMAITLGMAVPRFKSTIASGRVISSANDMVAALQSARSESIKQIKIAGVSIPSGGGSSWYTFIESSDLATFPANLLQRYVAPNSVRVDVTSDGDSDETPTYRSDGRLNSNTAIIMEFTSTGSTSKRILTIQPSGRVNVCDPSIIDSPCYSG